MNDPKVVTTPAAKKSGQIVLICAITALAFAVAMMVPQIRHMVFGGGGGGSSVPVIPGMTREVKESPRTATPMAEYTQFFGKMHPTAFEGKGVKRIQYYYLRPPMNNVAATLYPLVIFLHDSDGNVPGAVSLIRSKETMAQFPAYILVPQMPKAKTFSYPEKFSGNEFGGNKKLQNNLRPSQWPAASQGMHDVMVLVTRLVSAMNIDPYRIYIVGCDEGGTGVFGAISNAQYSDFFAGAVETGGVWDLNEAPRIKVPLVMMQGALDKKVDPVFPQMMSQIIQNSGGKVYYREFPDMEHSCTDPRLYTPAMWTWLFAQKRTPVVQPQGEVGGYQEDMQAPAHP